VVDEVCFLRRCVLRDLSTLPNISAVSALLVILQHLAKTKIGVEPVNCFLTLMANPSRK
jgi:hypothetical protein